MKATKLRILGGCIILMSGSVNAGAYLYGTIGQSTFDTGIAPTGTTIDDTDITASIGMGVELSDYVALEAGYVLLGETSLSTSSPVSETLYGSTVTIDGTFAVGVDGFTLGVKGQLPVSDEMSIFGRFGLYKWSSDAKFSGSVTIDGSTYSGSTIASLDDGTDPYFGVGIAYNVTEDITLDVNWTRYVLEVLSESLDVDTLNVGVSFNF